MSKPWGGIGAWAAESERADEEEREAAAAASQVENESFPNLKEAAKAKPKKKKMSLSEFTNSTSVASGSITGIGEYKGLTGEEMLRLPTGPKERSAEEMLNSRFGGGFSSYGRSGPTQVRNRDRDDGDGSWGGGRRSYGGFGDEQSGPSTRTSDFDQTSRADKSDNWASTKKYLPTFDSGRQNRYGSLDGSMGGVSRADEDDNWGSGKRSLPSRSSTFGTGFRDSGDSDRWNRGVSRETERERPRLVLNPPKGNAGVNSEGNEPLKTNKPNPFGAARPREEVLAQKGLDWKKLDSEIDSNKTSRPTSAYSSRPLSAQSTRSKSQGLQGIENVLKSRPKVNPFGDAKPREVLLEERGMDWRKIDAELEHRAVQRMETEEEKLLKEEIDNLNKELDDEIKANAKKESLQAIAADETTLLDILILKERELEKLTRDLDDKFRFGQKAIEWPSSGADGASILERPPSQSGKKSRNAERMDGSQFRSKGKWLGHADDRGVIQDYWNGVSLVNRHLKRMETEEEKLLKKEIDNLNKELDDEIKANAKKESLQAIAADETTLLDILILKERELEKLTCDLDDKFRFGQKAIEWQSSVADGASILESPPSQSGKKSRNAEQMDGSQFRSKGKWLGHADDRGVIQDYLNGVSLVNRNLKRMETEEEKLLIEEINNLCKELDAKKESLQATAEDETTLLDILILKETELEKLTRDLDDKFRFGQKAIEWPSSGADKAAILERPPSQSGKKSRNAERMDGSQFRSRGWLGHVDDRGEIQGDWNGVSLVSGHFERYRSRDRW